MLPLAYNKARSVGPGPRESLVLGSERLAQVPGARCRVGRSVGSGAPCCFGVSGAVDGRAVARTAVTRLERQRAPGVCSGGVSSITEASESRCRHHRSAHRCGQGLLGDRHLSSLAATGLHEGGRGRCPRRSWMPTVPPGPHWDVAGSSGARRWRGWTPAARTPLNHRRRMGSISGGQAHEHGRSVRRRGHRFERVAGGSGALSPPSSIRMLSPDPLPVFSICTSMEISGFTAAVETPVFAITSSMTGWWSFPYASLRTAMDKVRAQPTHPGLSRRPRRSLHPHPSAVAEFQRHPAPLHTGLGVDSPDQHRSQCPPGWPGNVADCRAGAPCPGGRCAHGPLAGAAGRALPPACGGLG